MPFPLENEQVLFTTLWTDERKISLIPGCKQYCFHSQCHGLHFQSDWFCDPLWRRRLACQPGSGEPGDSSTDCVINRDLLVSAVQLWAPRAGQMDVLMCCMIGAEKENAVHWSKPKSIYEIVSSQWVNQLEAHGQGKHSLFTAYDCSALPFHMESPTYQVCATLPNVNFKIKVIIPYCLLNWRLYLSIPWLLWRIDLLRLDMIILPPLFWHKHGNNCCFKVVNPSNMWLYFVLVRWQLYQYVFLIKQHEQHLILHTLSIAFLMKGWNIRVMYLEI